MNKEAQRIAIAKAVGDFEDLKRGVSFARSRDYLNDLNAMAEAEKTLDNTVDMQPSDLVRYNSILGEVCGKYYFHFNATAAQRAEAFLRTINKWEPTPAPSKEQVV